MPAVELPQACYVPLDSHSGSANIRIMTNLPATLPSLARAFEPERNALRAGLGDTDLSAAQIVSEARRALDRTGIAFAADTQDPHLHKAGLWLIEMVKAGAGVLDQGTGAEIVWHEMPKPKTRPWIGGSLFYGAALALGVVALLQDSRIGFISVAVLASLRFLDPGNWAAFKSRLPFVKAPTAIEDNSGRHIRAEARITANAAGFVDSLAEALRTADHILLRLAEPQTETHWRSDVRLMGLVQGLLEAREAHDGDFALKLIGQELESILDAEGIERVGYSKKTSDMFDVLPGIGRERTKLAAPALMAGDELIRRGTVWGADDA